MASIFIVRHGATDFNGHGDSKDRLRGWLDVPLNEDGEKDAHKAGKKLKGEKIDSIYCSDLQRTRKTAEIIAEEIGADPSQIIPSEAFRPWNLGDFQGEYTEEILEDMKKYITNPKEQTPNGESFNSFIERYLGSLGDLMDLSEETGKSFVIVAHYRNLELAKDWSHGDLKKLLVDTNELLGSKDIPTGGILRFDWDGKAWGMERE